MKYSGVDVFFWALAACWGFWIGQSDAPIGWALLSCMAPALLHALTLALIKNFGSK